MGIPAYTRIILIPDNEQSTREYGISRPMVILLAALILMFFILIGLLMASFAGKHEEREAISMLENQLAGAMMDIQKARALRLELEQMREAQEKLLTMLGVEGAADVPEDSLAAWFLTTPETAAEGLQRAATVAMTPQPALWPTTGYVTREYIKGNIVQGVKPHQGLDIAGPKDTPIQAAGSGLVTRTGVDRFLGNFVEIQHGLGYLTVYGHCSRIAVGKGDRVQAGQVVAYMGDTGEATATHLHFEIWHQGEAVDPRQILAGDPPAN